MLPGTPDRAFTTIQGNALDATNRALSDALVRLRDARAGRILNSQRTDRSGRFAFQRVDPGSYVVELLNAANDTVRAASQVLTANAGETVSVIVKLPFERPPLAGLLGENTAQAAVILGAAAATGVLTRAATNDVSPERAAGAVR